MLRYFPVAEPWGTFVEAKVNLPAVLHRERKKPGRVYLGTVCDPYQPVEARFRLSQQVLEILGRAGFQVEVLTKSDLIVRDINRLQRYPGFSVEMTITTLDERVQRLFEPGAVAPERRIGAVKRLVEEGVPVTVFVGPVLPYFSDSFDSLFEIFHQIARVGVQRVLVDRLNYLSSKMAVLRLLLQRECPQALPAFEQACRAPEDYAERLRELVARALHKAGLEGGVVF